MTLEKYVGEIVEVRGLEGINEFGLIAAASDKMGMTVVCPVDNDDIISCIIFPGSDKFGADKPFHKFETFEEETKARIAAIDEQLKEGYWDFSAYQEKAYGCSGPTGNPTRSHCSFS